MAAFIPSSGAAVTSRRGVSAKQLRFFSSDLTGTCFQLRQSSNARRVPEDVVPTIECKRPGIHPTWHEEAKVICNGEVVMTIGGTKPEYKVEVWSGNHPFFTGNMKMLDTTGRAEKFAKKWGMGSPDSILLSGLTSIGDSGPAEPLVMPKKAAKGKGKKK
mmetsp:Transcript_22688/g.37370  ORF Transcript_22688/g.37370 Transcript_22688/m.37370 type:complete len:160 (-) Transcript_22688:227-706(-)|eukprot:CAMPEP_0184643350 /NCGR_PEP_ID=MMETSP0308-20130426/183_1 /TAXON_ID=38269 /ORGANISM="Gloeochaete witrockiana, Strain SAG 46.84" /LENGTH=159 /DNA_ID=CAMNT_0027071227 /DNA_START=61 /DNA_END=540 /DNA_ORIENTATION=+